MILQMRMDERLAHGQVCVSWIKFLGASHLIIANDEVANDDFQKQMMSLGIPNDIKSIFTTIEKAIGILNDPRSNSFKIFLIVKTPKDALQIANNVQGIKEFNVGNIGSVVKLDGKTARKICEGVILDAENIELIKEIQKKVKEVYNQATPGYSKMQLKL
jgi:mannose/fructose/N-acetylgalactosamine-specific phosphotransferase system component IIB